MPKTKKAKLPKRIGGVKLPKELRRAGGKIVKAVNSPAGRELLAAGLSMAAAAAAAAVEKERVRRRNGSSGMPAERGGAEGAGAGSAGADKAARPASPSSPLRAANSDPHEIGAQLGKMAEAALAGLFKPKTK